MPNHLWSGPSRALQFHLDLYEKVRKTHHSFMNIPRNTPAESLPRSLTHALKLSTAMTGFDGASVSYHQDDESRMFDEDNLKRTFQTMTVELAALDTGETHYVSHSVMASVEAAAKTMETETLFDTDLPCPAGVIVFEYPLLMPDLDPETGGDSELVIPVRCVTWTRSDVMLTDGKTVQPGIAYSVYTNHDAYEEFYIGSYRKVYADRAVDIPDLLAGSAELRTWMTDSSGWAFGVAWDSAKYGQQVAFIRQFLLAYFRWTWQRILVPTPYTPSRAERKWVSRIKPPLEDGHIKVLRLRREIEHERRGDGEYQGVFDYQFIVRGHWKRQHYATLGPAKINGEYNPDSHRLIWLEPFVKGNPNGPLVVGHQVVAAVR